jgi:hypothetical protein
MDNETANRITYLQWDAPTGKECLVCRADATHTIREIRGYDNSGPIIKEVWLCAWCFKGSRSITARII